MRFTRGTFSVYLECATWSELRTFWAATTRDERLDRLLLDPPDGEFMMLRTAATRKNFAR